MIGNSYEFLRGRAQLAAPAMRSLLLFSVCMDLVRSATALTALNQGLRFPLVLLIAKILTNTLLPWIILRMGRVRAALFTYSWVALGFATLYTVISGGLYSSGGILQIAVILIAAILL